ncbi:MAG: type II toxin-antitoxin system RelE/ParE family toxin [Roseitalea porphyridii]|uniref:type II toxin-antitoxin system RelE/ParE family toxin n=1 Tax=Roseitalea porphyridii TaxID=1852022 RepID=UPI0032D98E0F
MIEVRKTAVFERWYAGLRDVQARVRIDARIDRISLGNFGDAKSVGSGVMELRLTYGPGYRLYFTRRQGEVVVLLCGGDKGSQRRDIEMARRLAKEL